MLPSSCFPWVICHTDKNLYTRQAGMPTMETHLSWQLGNDLVRNDGGYCPALSRRCSGVSLSAQGLPIIFLSLITAPKRTLIMFGKLGLNTSSVIRSLGLTDHFSGLKNEDIGLCHLPSDSVILLRWVS